ncbi:universal stress protein [Archangium violaceum]|uniref:universal stress protein n=1 Tax=Archangium violaceum TaxID=83451 RepID=UPI002B2B2049|nr:universal stress protein [Archangium gephyra]
MMPRSVLIPVDLLPNSERVVARTALLPLTENARVTLLHVVPKLRPRQTRQRIESDARKALDTLGAKLARALPKSTRIKTVVTAGIPAAEIARQAKSVKAELVVMGRVGRRALREFFIGSTAERVIRQARLPVLLVRLPSRKPYQRPLFALDADETALEVLSFGLQMIPVPRAPLPLVHAYDPPIQGFVYPSLTPEQSREHRRHYRQQAIHRIAKLLSTARLSGAVPGLDEVRWRSDVRYGSPRSVIPQAVARRRADLLVLGTHGRSGVAHALLGTVAGDVLREVPCDVLVVPPRQDAEAPSR